MFIIIYCSVLLHIRLYYTAHLGLQVYENCRVIICGTAGFQKSCKEYVRPYPMLNYDIFF